MKFLVLLLISIPCFADQYLIDEMESLKSSLDMADPGRQELTLRLADLYFDVSIQEGEELEGAQRMQQRQKALKLYRDVLEGRDGLERVSLDREILIRYQIARVYRKLNRPLESKKFFEEVFTSSQADKNLKREAAFSIAEFFEEEADFKRADEYYRSAISLCHTKAACNLSHYKRAWLLYKELRIDAAIVELKLALFDRKGQVREKIINDLMLFFSNRTTDGTDEISYIEDLIKRTGKNELLKQLVEAFYSSGNRVAGAKALVYLNKKSSDIFYEMRLLEEYYGFRDWEQIEIYLAALEKRSRAELPQGDSAGEFKEMIKRVIVQFGSEAEEDPKQYTQFLRRAIDRYLTFYPADNMRTKMQQGWLKAQDNELLKIKRLKTWIVEDIALGKKDDEIRKLRQTRLALAQKNKNPAVVLEEALEIANLLKNSPEAREFHYVAGLHYYKNNNYSFALNKFLPLAKLNSFEKVDKWAILAQNLILDIYNQQKNYKALSAQADRWLSLDTGYTTSDMKKELASMREVKTQSQFEYFASLGQDKRALEAFFKYCFDSVYPEKSCANAKVLAIQMADTSKTIALLERSKDEKALMVEYERVGMFKKAAQLQEKFHLNKNSELSSYFKVAAFYEMAQAFGERDRILNMAIKTFKKPLGAKLEQALYLTLDEAGLIDAKSLSLPWSLDRKIKLANRFSTSKSSIEFVAKQDQYAGKLWSKKILKRVQKKYLQLSDYKFHGRNSERRFKRRVKKLESFAVLAKGYLEQSDLETRIYLLDMLQKAYLSLGSEIMSAPIPEGLAEEVLMQVQANLTEMATPYLTVADDYLKLKTEQLEEVEEARKVELEKNCESEIRSYADLIKVNSIKSSLTAEFDYQEFNQLKMRLKDDPDNRDILKGMHAFYQQQNNQRLAGYFLGRLNQLGEKL